LHAPGTPQSDGFTLFHRQGTNEPALLVETRHMMLRVDNIIEADVLIAIAALDVEILMDMLVPLDSALDQGTILRFGDFMTTPFIGRINAKTKDMTLEDAPPALFWAACRLLFPNSPWTGPPSASVRNDLQAFGQRASGGGDGPLLLKTKS
jgi:hypothetical protein